MPCRHRKALTKSRLLIWRADLAENKEAKLYKHGGSGGAEDAAKAEFFGFRR
jgi:hypothetical protein